MQCIGGDVANGSWLEGVVLAFASALDEDLAMLAETLLKLEMEVQPREVLGGLLARQATLTKTIATTPILWTGHSADLFLRAMAEVHITIAWLLANGPERYRQYIAASIDQVANDLRCRETGAGNAAPSADEAVMLDGQREWIAQQCAMVGSLSGELDALPSLRAMAENAGCLTFFDAVYSPSAACAHSMWHHIEYHHLGTWERSVDDQPRRGSSPEPAADLGYLLLATRYWTMTVHLVDDNFGPVGPLQSRLANLRAVLTTGCDLNSLNA